MSRYTTEGSVRGSCGHEHRTLDAVLRCLERDQRGCASQGGYSDRRVVRTDGERLDEWERDELDEVAAP